MAVNFYIDKRPNKKGEVPIRCSICIHGKRFLSTTGITIIPEVWNNERQTVRATYKGKQIINSKGYNAKDINIKLKHIDTYFSEIEKDAPRNEIIDVKGLFLKKFGKGAIQVEKSNEFIETFDLVTLRQGRINAWTHATFEKFEALKNQILSFKNDNPAFSDFDIDGLTDFVEFLRTKRKLRNSTINKKLGFLKWFLKWAENEGLSVPPAYKSFNPKLKATNNKVVFLDWDELIYLFNFKFPQLGDEVTLEDINGKKYKKTVNAERTTMERVRDVFCFCCFTSLRYSDAANLKRKDISPNYITITTVKTADTLKIELNDYAKEILHRYEKSRIPYDKALPIISNQRMNDHLKLMGELCGFNTPVTDTYYRGNQRFDKVSPKWKKLATHTARRTFICNALAMGIPPQIVMKWTGHSDYKSMKPYIDVTDTVKADAMEKFNHR